MSGSIVVVGSLNADLVARVPAFPSPGETITGSSFDIYPGGKGANQAYAAARLGAEVHMIGRVGHDSHGRLLTSQLADVGVDTTRVVTDDSAPTGTALITIDDSGQNEIVVVPGANGRVTVSDVEAGRQVIESAGFVLLQLEVPLEAVAAAARIAHSAGAIVILDPAPAHIGATSVLPQINYVTPNETELTALTAGEGLATTLLDLGARRVVTKLGSAGAHLQDRNEEWSWPGFEVAPVDTTAAGDVWNGAFATALATGHDVDEAGRFANAAAAISVTRPGAQPSMPSREEVDAFISRSSP